MDVQHVKSITAYHRLLQLPGPVHPLISVIDYSQVKHEKDAASFVMDYYSIALKRNLPVKLRYGQQEYDFDEGLMSFIAPGQVLRVEPLPVTTLQPQGYLLLIHPDFLWRSPLAKTIRQYGFFDYAVNEALFLSDKEEATITQILENIQQEYHSNIDQFTQDLIIAQVELLLKYADRFYHRQFLTRKISNHQTLSKVEEFLTAYFSNENLADKGLPTVQQVAEHLHMSANYLSSLLKVLTGQNTQQHIHNKLIEKAKEKLSVTNSSISEIAYELGFEHPQSFSKLFKSKTDMSPHEFRASFN
ncbi:MAG: helix-turn-helix domain-containing protein [Lacibacter sp.]